MKTTAFWIASVFMVAISIQTSAQTGTKVGNKPATVVTDIAPSPNAYQTPSGSGGITKSNAGKIEGFEGEMYLGTDWPAGIIILRNGATIDNYLLRYNILEDQMQFISGKDTLAFASPQEINTLTFSGHTFVYEAFQCENTIRKGYFELIEPGKNRLLLKRVVTTVLDEQPAGPEAKKYFVDECYFISKPGQPANKLMCNKKSVLTVLNEHGSEIEEYLKITGNKVKSPEDLKKLVAYYNSLE